MVWPSLWSLTNVYLCPDSSSQIQTRVSNCVLDIYKTELLIFPLNQLHPILLNETLSFKPHKPKSLQFTAELSHSHLIFNQELFLTLLSKYTTPHRVFLHVKSRPMLKSQQTPTINTTIKLSKFLPLKISSSIRILVRDF